MNCWNVFLINAYSTLVILSYSPFNKPIINASDLLSFEPFPLGNCFKYCLTSSIVTFYLWSLCMKSCNWSLVMLSIGSIGYINSYLKTSSKCLIEWYEVLRCEPSLRSFLMLFLWKLHILPQLLHIRNLSLCPIITRLQQNIVLTLNS